MLAFPSSVPVVRGLGLSLVPAWVAFLLVEVMALPQVLASAHGSAPKAFDIPAGDAVVALKRFSAQSGAQVIFPEDAIEGSKTKAVRGTYTPTEAIEVLLSGTPLKAAQDRESGAFAVSRISAPVKGSNDPNGSRAARTTAGDRPVNRITPVSLNNHPLP